MWMNGRSLCQHYKKRSDTLSISVSVEDKRLFIKWFLANHEVVSRESVWILNYLVSDDEALARVSFVEQAHHCPRAIIFATEGPIAFQYYSHGLLVLDAEKAFHDIRLHEEPVYIEIILPNAMQSPHYVAVLEEHSYGPAKVEASYGIADVAAQLAMQYNEAQLIKALDEALDAGDKERFLQLSKQYERLKS